MEKKCELNGCQMDEEEKRCPNCASEPQKMIACKTCKCDYPEDFGGVNCPRCEDRWDEAREVVAECAND